MQRSLAPTALVLTALLAGATALPAPAGAQTASLVRDLVLPAPGGLPATPEPDELAALGHRLVFSAFAFGFGRELWTSDGTAAGTELLADLCESGCSSDPEIVGTTGGVLFFVASPVDRHGQDLLWRTDGTRRGTFLLTGAGQPLAVERPSFRHERGVGPDFAVAGGRLYFDQPGGLWASDGTAKGTVLVKDLGIGSSLTRAIVAAGNQVFCSTGGANGFAVWRSDGTPAGTRLLRSFDDLLLLTPAASRLYFVARSGDNYELWTSDGTAGGTRQVTSFGVPSPFLFDQALTTVGDRIYFMADDVTHGSELWASDGTPGGTKRLTEFGFNRPFGGPSKASGLGVLGDRVVFRATDGLHPAQLWVTAGTPGSTAPLAAVELLSSFSLVGGRALFVARDDSHGVELWATDGTPGGTGLVADLCPGVCDASVTLPIPYAGGALFVAAFPSPALWRTDGTPGGTRRFASASLGTPDFYSFTRFAAVGSQVFYFTSSPTAGAQLWASDGAHAGERLVAAFATDGPGASPDLFAALGGQLFFVARDGLGASQLWRTAGSAESTAPVSPPGRTAPFAPDGPLVPAAGLLFFTRGPDLWRTDGTADGTFGLPLPASLGVSSRLAAYRGKLLFPLVRNSVAEIWQSDGTAAGTVQAFPLPAGLRAVDRLSVVGDEIYFQGGDGSGPTAVWRSDGTTAGTRPIASPVVLPFAPSFAQVGPSVFFFGIGEDETLQLFRTDGTLAGTAVLSHFGSSNDLSPLVAYNGAVYFFALSDSDRRSLFRSDGTSQGPVQVAEFNLPDDDDPFRPEPASLTVFAGKLFFAVDDGAHGREPWSSDGTAAGTALVRDLFPGLPSARPAGLTVAGGRLFFAAEDSAHGRELWSTDGTAAGTRLVQDVAPGAAPASPGSLTEAGGRLYFSADDGLHGRELWSLPLSGPAGCQPGDTRLCLAANRFQVEIAWKDFQGNTGVGHAVALTADTGYFWFFAPSNVEAIVKVLDARSLNQAFWVFYGALSSVEYTITVTDTETGLTRRYFNPSGQLASVGDTNGFGPLGAFDTKGVSARTDATLATTATGTCAAGPQRLCLSGNRFAVTAAWKDFSGHTGTGTAVALTADTGYFWFFSPSNVEVVTKVLDGRELNDKFWLFYGALSNVEYTLTVTDTATGAVRTYKNPSGQFGSIADTGAF